MDIIKYIAWALSGRSPEELYELSKRQLYELSKSPEFVLRVLFTLVVALGLWVLIRGRAWPAGRKKKRMVAEVSAVDKFFPRRLAATSSVKPGTVLRSERPIYVGTHNGAHTAKVCSLRLTDPLADLVAAIIFDRLYDYKPGALFRLKELQNFRVEQPELPPLAMTLYRALKPEYRTKLAFQDVGNYWRVASAHAVPIRGEGGFPGKGLFRLVALCPHSCEPNAFLHAEGQDLRLLPLRSIESGTEVTVSWLPLDSWYAPTPMRCRQLHKNFNLSCACRRCSELPEAVCSFQCVNCRGEKCCPDKPMTAGQLTGEESAKLKCLECGHVTEANNAQPSALHFDAFRRYHSELEAPEDEQVVVQLCRAVCRCVEYLHGGVHPEAGNCLGLSAMIEGNREDAEEACRIHEGFYGKNAAVTQGVRRRTKNIKAGRKRVSAEKPQPRKTPELPSDSRPTVARTAAREQNHSGHDANGENPSSTAQAALSSTLEDMRAMMDDLRSERERLERRGREAIASGASMQSTLLSSSLALD